MRSLIVAVLLALAGTVSADTGYIHVYSYPMPPEALYAVVERTDGAVKDSDLYGYSTSTDNVSGDATVIR